MSFSTAAARFAVQAAKHRRDLSPATVQPYTAAGAADGGTVSVFLSPVRVERELGETGFVLVSLAQLRVLKTSRWQPTEGSEFVDTATDDRFRCRTATGSSSDFPAEIVCEVVKIDG